MKSKGADFPREEYAILKAATAPGTARELLMCDTASTGTDVAMADLLCDARPSGVVLPETLRRKLRLMNKANAMALVSDVESVSKGVNEQGSGSNASESSSSAAAQNFLQDTFRILNTMQHVTLFERVAHYDAKRLHSKSPIANIQSAYEQIEDGDKDDIKAHLPLNYDPPYNHVEKDRTFTTTELEKKLSRANAALLDIQKQLYRGEEIYFQDTDMHGNIYKGWEGAFIDSKAEQLGIQDIDNISSDDITSIVQSHSTAAPTRKIHNDMRWFSSSSCAVENGNVRGFERRRGQRSFAPSLTSISPTVPIPISTVANQMSLKSNNSQDKKIGLKGCTDPSVKGEVKKTVSSPLEDNVKVDEVILMAKSSTVTPAAQTTATSVDTDVAKSGAIKSVPDSETKVEESSDHDMGPPDPRKNIIRLETDTSSASNKSPVIDNSAQQIQPGLKASESKEKHMVEKKDSVGEKVNQDNASDSVKTQEMRADGERKEDSDAQDGNQKKDLHSIEKSKTEVLKKEKDSKRKREEGETKDGNDDNKDEEEVETRTSSRLRKKRK